MRNQFGQKVLLVLSATLRLLAAREPVVPAGHSPEIYCTACCRIVGNLEEQVVPALERSIAKRAEHTDRGNKAAATSSFFGDIDTLVEDGVERACRFASTWHESSMRKSCEHIVEEQGEHLASSLSRWARERRARSELLGRLCNKVVPACHTRDLKSNASKPDEKHLEKHGYRSKRLPARNDGPVFEMNAETMRETLHAPDRDVIAYFQFTDSRHEIIGPRFERLALLMASLPNRPRTLQFVKIDARSNDLPPPDGAHIKESSMMVYAGSKDHKLLPTFYRLTDPDKTLCVCLAHEVCMRHTERTFCMPLTRSALAPHKSLRDECKVQCVVCNVSCAMCCANTGTRS